MSPMPQWFINLGDWRYWRHLVINSLLFVVVLIAVILAIRVIGEPYFDNPPVVVVSANAQHLGEVCPGEAHEIHNIVTIEDPVIAIYYISVMGEFGIHNIIGTQQLYPGFPHPVAGMFHQYFPWVVPNLPPGNYTRVFAARGTDTEEKTVFISTKFTIGEHCND
jgi:hypothetical protein